VGSKYEVAHVGHPVRLVLDNHLLRLYDEPKVMIRLRGLRREGALIEHPRAFGLRVILDDADDDLGIVSAADRSRDARAIRCGFRGS